MGRSRSDPRARCRVDASQQLVDRLAPDEARLLSTIARKFVHDEADATMPEPAETPAEQAPAKRRFSFIGIMDGDPDLAARSAQILRDELGHRAA